MMEWYPDDVSQPGHGMSRVWLFRRLYLNGRRDAVVLEFGFRSREWFAYSKYPTKNRPEMVEKLRSLVSEGDKAAALAAAIEWSRR